MNWEEWRYYTWAEKHTQRMSLVKINSLLIVTSEYFFRRQFFPTLPSSEMLLVKWQAQSIRKQSPWFATLRPKLGCYLRSLGQSILSELWVLHLYWEK